ncbi:MAG: helix-turn-helix domain-containing protein [Terriglobia bacterium]
MHIGKRLRMLREAKGLSQGDIERRSGLLRSYISRVEGEYTVPSLVTLRKFAKALDLESYQLLLESHGRPQTPSMPKPIVKSKSMKKLAKMYEGMSSSQRRLLLTLASKLSKN